jgi:hypothetical protein
MSARLLNPEEPLEGFTFQRAQAQSAEQASQLEHEFHAEELENALDVDAHPENDNLI